MAGPGLSDPQPPVPAFDPCGLIRSFLNRPPTGQITPNDVFVVWLLSHRHRTAAEAAQAVLGAYGGAMSQSGSRWLKALRALFMDVAAGAPDAAGAWEGRHG